MFKKQKMMRNSTFFQKFWGRINPISWPTWLVIILPGVLFVLGWEPVSLELFLFLGFVPFFELVRRFHDAKRWKYYGSIYLALLFWNITTTWWVYFASQTGVIFMFTLNALFMLLPFIVFRFTLKKWGWNWSFWAFMLVWMLYEMGHHRWDLTWPWLCLGNSFSSAIWMIQWYEFTGTMGGTALLLFLNFRIFHFAITKERKPLVVALSSVGLLTLVSLVLYFTVSTTNGAKTKVAVLQPSFDPWNEKFVRDPLDLESEMIQLSMAGIDTTVDWLLWPETSLVYNINLSLPQHDPQIQLLKEVYLGAKRNVQMRQLAHIQPWSTRLKLISGVNASRNYVVKDKPTRTARKSKYTGGWYDNYNAAMYLDSNDNPDFYEKSKLVPGTEQMPFIQTFPFIENWALSLDENSMTGSLGVSDTAKPLGPSSMKVAPIICYESIYGEYVGEFIKRGAQWIAVITNDAWWGNTPGYRQHFSYAKLRAIEHRKWVARSANTGTSGFIDPRGIAHDESKWYDKTCKVHTIYANTAQTVYCKLGDFIVWIIIGIIGLIGVFASSKSRASSHPTLV